MVRELFNIPYIIFVSASGGTYVFLPLVATLYIFQVTSILHEVNS